MPDSALTLGDCLGCLRGVVAFAALLLAPGYCVAWACNLLGFRLRSLSERLAWAIALSFGVIAILSVEVAKYGSLSAVVWLARLCAVGMAGLIAWELWWQPRGFLVRWGWLSAGASWLGVGVVAGWTLFVMGELVDVAVGNHLYLSVTIFDHALRTAFTDAVLRTGVPPANPLYWPRSPAPMRYYYFWYVLTAAAARLGAATARQAMIASVVWAGFGLAAVLSLYCRHFLPARPNDGDPSSHSSTRWPRIVVALALLGVTGLDILPALVKAMLRLPMDPDMEWWSSDQVASWMDSLLWVPHHVAGLVCCLIGFLLVWMSKDQSAGQRLLCALLAGLSFASAFGLSIWVPIAFAMTMLAWMLWALASEQESRPRIPVLLGAGLVVVLALLPYLHELRDDSLAAATVQANGPNLSVAATAGGSRSNESTHLLRFGVRRIIDAGQLSTLPWFAEHFGAHAHVAGSLASIAVQILLLLPGYFLELGFYGFILFVALLALRRSQLDEPTRNAIFLTVAALLVATFLRSTVIGNNDFGWRSVLIGQFFLLLLAMRWFEGALGEPSRWLRRTMLTTMWIGLAGTAYQAVVLRLYLPVQDRLGGRDGHGLAEQAMALRRGFAAMGTRIPPDAVVQFNTAQPSDYFHSAQILFADRQMATALPQCASSFGGSAAACPGVEAGSARLFATPALSAEATHSECMKLGINDLIATRWDEVWKDYTSWVWQLPAVVDTGDVRVVGCAISPK